MKRRAPDDSISRKLVFVGKQISEQFHALLAEHGSTIPTWAVLSHAHATPGLSQVALAGQIGIEGPTLARHLDRLCADGLVRRRRDDLDRRVIRIELTEAGLRRWAELKDMATTMDRRLTVHLAPEDRLALDQALDLILDAMEDAHAPAHHR
ncbi:MAG: MarR family winged helix-turn-helix transcriptional regulator [Acidimicrobiales bacterium]